jgi:signal transduction histidine kinase/ActR/RegA family two-component response regulator
MQREPALNPVDPRQLDALVTRAWHVLCTDALRLRDAAADIARLSGSDPCVQGHAASFDARGRLSEGDRAGCEQSLAHAELLFERCADLDGTLQCLDLRAFLLSRDGRFDAAHDVLAPALQRIDAVRSPVLRYFLLKRHAGTLELQGRFDEALRAHHVAVSAARQSGLPAALANALSALGGFQASELNLVDALPLCEEAWALCESTRWFGMIGAVAPNLMMALSGTGRHAEAAALAQRLLALEPELAPYQRDRRLFMYAIACDRAGDTHLAQRCLDLGIAERGHAAPPRAEWAWTQASLWNRCGRAADALALVRRYLDGGVQAVNGPDFPVDLASLHQQAALACEALADFRAALEHERLAARAREQAQQRASHARRLSLQISMELEAAHRQRDDALQGQRRLAQLNAELKSANEAKSRFLAAASHDLRQPVHALTLQTAALRQVLDAPRQFEMLASIERCAGALSGMFDALLDLSRMDAGALQPQRQRLDLGSLLLRLVEEQSPAAQAKGLRLALRISGGGARTTDSDPALLEAMLRNLIVNAIKYTPAGGVLVCARPWQQGAAAAAPQWRVQVWDTGIGIGEADARRVFDEFYQVDNPARRRVQGLGLGLAIVQRLARLLGHAVSLRSVPGRGSCFEVRLPAVDAHTAALPDRQRVDAPLQLHVAVIEDDPDVLEAMQSLLSQWGCRVTLGESADDILAALRDEGADGLDAALADLRLPGPHNGAEEVVRLRQHLQRTIPALILTGDVAASTVQLLAQQQLPWLAKPVSVDRLVAWLADVEAGLRR